MGTLADNPAQLAELATLGWRSMATFRKARLTFLNKYAGPWHGKDASGSSKLFPLNNIYHAATTLVPNLVFKNPKARVGARYLAHREYAAVLALALNHLVKETHLADTLRKIITDSIFLAGFMKCGLGVSGQTLDIDGFWHDIGQPYCDRVDPDDIILDPDARDWEEQRFIGNRFRVDREELLDQGMFDASTITQMSSRYSAASGKTFAASLAGGKELQEADQIRDSVELAELWLPGTNTVVVMPVRADGTVEPTVLREVDYEGPEAGPYMMLGYAYMPDNILPVAPAGIWYDLSVMANRAAAKAGRQAERQKSVLAYEAAASEDARRIVEAPDGDTIQVNTLDQIREVSYGGVDDSAYQYMQWAETKFSEMAGNIDLLAGTGSREATATQAEMVNANANVRVADMQERVYELTSRAMQHLSFLLHTDPLIDLPLIKRVQGQDEQVAYTPEMREGDWLDYNITVEPYSMSRQDPNVKVRRVLEFAGNVIPALANAAQMLGPAFNLEKALILLGREMGIDELDELINSQALQTMLATQLAILEQQGVVMDAKPQQFGMQSIMAGAKIGQPNPLAQVPSGMGPAQEQRSRAQETAGELQPGARV